MKKVKRTFVLFCIIFTIATIFSSSIQLVIGILEDTNVHILDRAILTLIGTLTITLIMQHNFKKKIYKFMIPYMIFISLAMIYVWVCGFWQDLHPNAYRDVFINDTIAYIVVYIAIEICGKLKCRQK